MVAFPAQVEFATITAVLTSAVVDGSDPDLLPDAVPLVGQVSFSPDKVNGQLLVPTATPKLMVSVQPMPFALAADGTLLAKLVVIPGATYTVSFAVSGVSIFPFSIGPLTAGQSYDLADLAPVAALNGIQLTKGDPGVNGAPGVNGWAPSTAYVAGQPVLSPTGDVVAAKVAFTSGATYVPANWNVVAATPGTATKTALDAAFVTIKEAPLSPYRYGFVGDGVADETAALQATFNALPTGMKPGAMLVPAGEHKCSGLVFSGKPFDFAGMGEQATKLVLQNHVDNTTPMLKVSGVSYGPGTIHDIQIANLTAPANPGPGVYVTNNADIHLKGVWIGGAANGVVFENTTNCSAHDVTVETCQSNGFWVHGSQLIDLVGVQAFQNQNNGVEVGGNGAVQSTGVMLTDSKIIENYHHGLLWNNVASCSAVDNIFDNNSKDFSSGTHINYDLYDNIAASYAYRSIIANNVHTRTNPYAFTRNGVSLDAGCNKCFVISESLPPEFFRTNTLTDAGISTTILTEARQVFRGVTYMDALYLYSKATVLGAAVDPATTQALVNDLRAKLVAANILQ